MNNNAFNIADVSLIVCDKSRIIPGKNKRTIKQAKYKISRHVNRVNKPKMAIHKMCGFTLPFTVK